MDIKERILALISNEKLTSSAFADSIGVQRSSISHILSGRNKPSLDFLEKILLGYTKYNAEWLITGQGTMLKEQAQAQSLKSPVLLDKQNSNSEGKGMKTDTNLFNQPKVDAKEPEIPSKHDIEKNKNATIPPKNMHSMPNSAALDRIVFFYDDGTFTVYKPNEK